MAIVESDLLQLAKFRAAVEEAGLRAETFPTAAAALPRLRERACALAIVGLDLCDEEALAFFREVSPLVPVIAAVRACTTDRCIRALEHGADDCVMPDTSERELAARIRSVLRRTPQPEDAHTASISLTEMRVRSGGVHHDLTRGETELLAVLLQHSPSPVTVARLIELLGARRGTIESRIKSLRKKLGPGRLVSRGSVGYQLVEE